MTGMLSVSWIQRQFANGTAEELRFEAGVNLLVGRPNTGKTKWLDTLDFLLADTGENPFGSDADDRLAERYVGARTQLSIDNEPFVIERRWRELGAKTKIFVNDESYSLREFQQFLLDRLQIPLLHFPKGNPLSGQPWPELSFRMLLRHIFRRQYFWGDIVDQQPDAEQHACVLQYLGLAERVFSKEYGELIQLKMQSATLRSRRESYNQTLTDLARDLLAEADQTVDATAITVAQAQERLQAQIQALQNRRLVVLQEARDKAVPTNTRSVVDRLSEQRSRLLTSSEELSAKVIALERRLAEMHQYRSDLTEEFERMARAQQASSVLADLRVTHCPACDQVVEREQTPDYCFLCSQPLPPEPAIAELGAIRLRYEADRLTGELKEANELVTLIERDLATLRADHRVTRERLAKVELELGPARKAVSALVQGEISAIDRQLGELSERQRQLQRIASAVGIGQDLERQIEQVEALIAPLQRQVDATLRDIDFDEKAALLEQGMNDYIDAINRAGNNVWRHSRIRVQLDQQRFSIKVGTRPWRPSLGGTDRLYFLMAYHYGLLSLSNKSHCHYPGLSIIDVPAEFAGEAVEDKENFIVHPFIDLLSNAEYEGTQLIITGASFAGLQANRIHLTHVHVA